MRKVPSNALIQFPYKLSSPSTLLWTITLELKIILQNVFELSFPEALPWRHWIAPLVPNSVLACILQYLRKDDLFLSRGWGRGGGIMYRGGAAPALRISLKKGSFLRPQHVRDFVKGRYFFVPRYEVWGVKIPLQSTKCTWLWHRVTPLVNGLPSLLPPLAATKHPED